MTQKEALEIVSGKIPTMIEPRPEPVRVCHVCAETVLKAGQGSPCIDCITTSDRAIKRGLLRAQGVGDMQL